MEHIRDEILNNHLNYVNEEIFKQHMIGFIDNFIISNQKDRWKHLLVKNRKRAWKNAGKLESHLVTKNCTLLKINDLPINFDNKGIYYNFYNFYDDDKKFLYINNKNAFILGQNEDAIYSIIPGKLVLYFSHIQENKIWLCKKK